ARAVAARGRGRPSDRELCRLRPWLGGAGPRRLRPCRRGTALCAAGDAVCGNAGLIGRPPGRKSREERMDISVIVAFAAVAAIAIATPGPTVLLAFANGSRFGIRRAIAGMAGAVLSDLVLVGAVSLGLGALLAASDFWFSVLKWVGLGYRAVLGIMILRSPGSAYPYPGMADARRREAR